MSRLSFCFQHTLSEIWPPQPLSTESQTLFRSHCILKGICNGMHSLSLVLFIYFAPYHQKLTSQVSNPIICHLFLFPVGFLFCLNPLHILNTFWVRSDILISLFYLRSLLFWELFHNLPILSVFLELLKSKTHSGFFYTVVNPLMSGRESHTFRMYSRTKQLGIKKKNPNYSKVMAASSSYILCISLPSGETVVSPDSSFS